MAFCITNINVVSILDDSPGSSCLVSSANNVSIVRGSTFRLLFDLQSQTTAEDGTISTAPSDITGYSINMSIKSSSSSNSDLLFCSTQNRMIDIDFDTARVTLQIPVKHTLRLPIGNLYYMIRLISPEGETQIIIQGIAKVSDSAI
jgi:hypothetical protein